ncbi:hypothetical protein T484DRAFT_1880114 [Baffinella frigidus]|nr:hypothetical protein T484DRAFT_1880114 [Cryptophyta sp. CCMP2293]
MPTSITAIEVDKPKTYFFTSEGADDSVNVVSVGFQDGEGSIPPVGFEITSINFDHTCMSQGCWLVDVRYSPGSASSANGCWLVDVRYSPGTTSSANGCWVVDVRYSPGSASSANVLYLPRAVNTNYLALPTYSSYRTF